MINALDKFITASSAPFCANGCVRAVVLAALLGGAASSAVAGGDPYGQSGYRDEPQNGQQSRDAQRYEAGRRNAEARGYEQRADSQSYDQQRRQLQEQSREASRRGGRLTPDERRDLRRQINEAGQDIYANPPRR